MHKLNIVFILAITALAISCLEDEQFVSNPRALPDISTDTVTFDTVFTDVGSVTKSFKLYNPHDATLKIKEIKLAGNNDYFTLNINGKPADMRKNLEINSNDSLYVFVQVKVDPTNRNNPLLVKDSVMVRTEDARLNVKLVAYGQDVYLVDRGLIPSDQVWTAEKPYLVRDFMLVDTARTLTIEQGVQMHFTKGARMVILGNLQVQGTREEPVVFQGSRLQWAYRDVPGQWGGIWMPKGSGPHQIDHAIIKNAIIGIQLDTVATWQKPQLTLTNSVVKHMTYAGILAQTSGILAANNLIYDCGSHALALSLGGNYEFYHTTLANYWSSRAGHGIRNESSLLLNNFYEDTTGVFHHYDLEKAYFGNCIIYGNNKAEIEIQQGEQGVFNYTFDHSLIAAGDSLPTPPEHFINCIIDPEEFAFEDPYEPKFNYHLDTLSPARNAGDPEIVEARHGLLQYDLDGNDRTADVAPDIGVFERVKETE